MIQAAGFKEATRFGAWLAKEGILVYIQANAYYNTHFAAETSNSALIT